MHIGWSILIERQTSRYKSTCTTLLITSIYVLLWDDSYIFSEHILNQTYIQTECIGIKS